MDIGDRLEVKIRTGLQMIGVLLDSFGKNIQIEEEDGGAILVSLSCAEESMYRWAMLHGGEAEIVEPENLRERLRNTISRMAELYKA